MLTPIDNTIVTTVANPSGIAATAKAIAVLKESKASFDVMYSNTKTIIQIKKAFPEIPITSDFEEFCKNRIVDYETDNEDSDEQYNSYHTKLGYRSEISFDRYSGSYAQDEMEYSDDDIDTIFDGYPNAYWNID